MVDGVSVIVCCYNSSGLITETIKHLCLQKVNNSIAWEVVVVNNASSDNTSDVAAMTWQVNSGGANFKIVNQPIPGLSFARQKGVEVSTYDFLIFCDDDNHFENNYVEEAYTLMSQNSEIGIIGGWIKPKLSFYPGKWIETQYHALAIGRQAEHSKYVEWVFGAGMVLRKKIFNDLKSRNIDFLLTDRKGKSQSSGGDAELCQLTKFIGYEIYFSPTLILYHQIEDNRLTRESFVKSNFQNLHATVHLYILENLISNKNQSLRKIKSTLLVKRIIRIFNAIPRLILGRDSFLNFLEIYVGSALISWIFFHGSEIKKSFVDIKQNLYDGQ